MKLFRFLAVVISSVLVFASCDTPSEQEETPRLYVIKNNPDIITDELGNKSAKLEMKVTYETEADNQVPQSVKIVYGVYSEKTSQPEFTKELACELGETHSGAFIYYYDVMIPDLKTGDYVYYIASVSDGLGELALGKRLFQVK